MSSETTGVNYRKGILRLLMLVGIAWAAVWSLNIADDITNEQHRKLHVLFLNGQATFNGLTLVSYDRIDYRGFVEDVIINGRRYFLFFGEVESKDRSAAEHWAKNLTRQDIGKILEVEQFSRRNAIEKDASIALGVPAALAALWSLGVFIYRGFMPKRAAAA
jgi:hypothetical protein